MDTQALQLYRAAKSAQLFLEGGMTEEKRLNHMLDCDGPDTCVLCELTEAIEAFEENYEEIGTN